MAAMGAPKSGEGRLKLAAGLVRRGESGNRNRSERLVAGLRRPS